MYQVADMRIRDIYLIRIMIWPRDRRPGSAKARLWEKQSKSQSDITSFKLFWFHNLFVFIKPSFSCLCKVDRKGHYKLKSVYVSLCSKQLIVCYSQTKFIFFCILHVDPSEPRCIPFLEKLRSLINFKRWYPVVWCQTIYILNYSYKVQNFFKLHFNLCKCSENFEKIWINAKFVYGTLVSFYIF